MGEMDIEGLTELVENNIPKNVEEIFLNKIMNGIFTFNELIIGQKKLQPLTETDLNHEKTFILFCSLFSIAWLCADYRLAFAD